jgi:hypothetical protein
MHSFLSPFQSAPKTPTPAAAAADARMVCPLDDVQLVRSSTDVLPIPGAFTLKKVT